MFGQTKKFKMLLQNEWQTLYRVAYSWTHDNALACDLVQETITRSLKHTNKFSTKEDTRIWLFKVLKNCWRDHLRKQKNQIDISDVELESNTNLEEEHHKNQIVQQVRSAFNNMTMEHREIISLVVMEGFSYEAVANILDIPTGTVMSRLSRARQSLRKHLKEINFPDENFSPTLWRVK